MEEWRAVVGWEGLYEVSDAGRVRSLPRIVEQGNRWGGINQKQIAGGLMVGGLDSHGYRQVTLSRRGERIQPLVHHLVLEAFGPPRPGSQWTADHEDGKRTNNRIGNLRWFLSKDQGRNRHHVRNKTGFVGVSENPKGGPNPYWASARDRDGKKVFLGMHTTAEAAHEAYRAYRETQFTHA
jgi:hypothetical protein